MSEEKSQPTSSETQLEVKAKEIADAKTEKTESPLEEARRLNTENKTFLAQIRKEREDFEQKKAEWEISGRAEAGQRPMTQDDIDQKEADKMLNRF